MTRRISPAVSDRAASTPSTMFLDSTAYRRQDGYAAPDLEDRADAAFLAEALARGYRLAAVCIDCGHGIFTEASLRRHRGPRCAAKAVAE